MIQFNRRPGIFHEWKVAGFRENGMPVRKGRMNLKCIIDISYDREDHHLVQPLVTAYKGLFKGDVRGPEGKPMVLGVFAKGETEGNQPVPQAALNAITAFHLQTMFPETKAVEGPPEPKVVEAPKKPWWRRLLSRKGK